MLDQYRFNVFAIHRRFGKSFCIINHLLRAALMANTKDKNKPNYRPKWRGAYISPSYKQSKNIAWDYLKTFTAKIPNTRWHETELRCDLPNGSRITLLGAENPSSLRGIYLDFCAIDEVAQCPASLFPEVIRPALSDRKGSCVFIGTPYGTMNYFYDLWEQAATTSGWNRHMYRADETNVLDQEELDAAKASMTEEQYNQEFLCSWSSSVSGSIYGKEIGKLEDEGKITEVPHDPHQLVNTYWDIGVHDYTSIIMAQIGRGGEIRVIDHIEDRGHALPHYRRLLEETEYNFGAHYGPHDLTVTEFGNGITRLDAAAEQGIRFRIVPRIPIEDGIHACKMMLPRCVFDRVKCKQLLANLKHYHRAYDEKARVFKNRPVHDFSSHSSDACRYMATAITEMRNDKTPPQIFADNQYNPFEAHP
tara:strand:- start:19654 stop:20913 length:1260 start_codon:yes stop_codon:yes gene_type:complete